MSAPSTSRRRRVQQVGLAAVMALAGTIAVTSTTSAGSETYDYAFEFVNGVTLTGSATQKTTVLANAGGSSVANPTGMAVHLSCSDKFEGGWGQKDGPSQSKDTAWRISSYSISKIKDGKVDKTCSGDIDASAPANADGKYHRYTFEFVNGVTLTGTATDKTAFVAGAGGHSVDNPTGMEVHLSCSDKFEGGWGQKDGPNQSADSAWQISSYLIEEVDKGEVKKSCGDSFAPPTPVGDPAIDIEKYVNGVDADEPTGPVVNVGDTVTFSYVVTNIGEVPLTDVAAVDQTLGPISCPKTALVVGESMDCSPKTELVTSPGQMFMEASVTATGASGPASLADQIPSNGKGRIYGFTFVNGTTITGVATDGNTIFLPNAGGTSASNPTGMDVHVSCSDDFPGGWGKKDGPVQGVDTAWQIASFEIIKFKDGDVDKRCGAGILPVTKQVSDSDPVYFLANEPANPAIDIEKYVNGDDADAAPGPSLNVGDTATFTYVVTNTGDVPLSSVAVVDSTLGPVTCPKTDLAVNESMECDPHSEVVTVPGAMFMDATTTGFGAGTVVMDVDPVYFFVVEPARPGIDIEKYVNGDDADTPPGIRVPLGSVMTFDWQVTNTGNTVLTDITVVDDTIGLQTCPKTTLQLGETMSCSPVEVVAAAPGEIVMKSTVTGFSPQGVPVTDMDPVHILVELIYN